MKARVLKGRRKNAFTLIEMLIVLIIVALLMAIIIPNVAGQKERIEKQAKKLLQLDENTTITLPINIPQP